MQFKLKPICAAVMLMTTHLALAEQTEALVLPRVDVIGTQEQLLKTPSSATIIKQEELESSHVLTVNEALRKVPGVVVRDEEGLGIRPNISIRGLNPTRSTKVLLLEDGIPLTYAPYGDNASYYFPSIDRFSSIEVLKGSEQIKYGPQTAGGVINFITPNAPENFGGHMSVTAGNRDYLNTKINVGGKGVLFDYTHKEGDGARDKTHSNIEDLNVKMTKSLGEDHAITVRANWFSEDSQVSYTGLTQKEYENFGGEYNSFNHDSFKATRYGVSATHDWQINTNALLTTNLYYSYFDRDWWRQSSNSGNIARQSATGAGVVPPIAISVACTTLKTNRTNGLVTNGDTCPGNEGRLRTYDSYGVEPRLTVTHAWGELQLGAKAHFEEQNRKQINGTTPNARAGTLVENNSRETDAYSGFISNRFDIGQFSITPLVRYEHIENLRTNRMTVGSGAGTEGKASLTEWIPGIGFAYNPHDNLTVFAGVHRGFAPPRTEDLIKADGGVADVDAERSTNYELGFRAKPVKGLNVAATAFHNDFKNLIAVGSIAAGSTPLAQGEATFTGLELSGQYDFDNGFYSNVAYTWLPVAEQDTPFTGVASPFAIAGFNANPALSFPSAKGNRQPYAPENTLTAALGYKMGAWNAQLEAVHVGEQYSDFAETKTASADGQRGEISSYTLWNAAVNYRHEPMKTTFFVTGKNLFDKEYITDRTRGILTGMPRLVQVGVRYDF